MKSYNPTLGIHFSQEERQLLEAAAKQSGASIVDYVRLKALETAEMETLENRIVTIPSADWQRFNDWADAPPKSVPALAILAGSEPAWQD